MRSTIQELNWKVRKSDDIDEHKELIITHTAKKSAEDPLENAVRLAKAINDKADLSKLTPQDLAHIRQILEKHRDQLANDTSQLTELTRQHPEAKRKMSLLTQAKLTLHNATHDHRDHQLAELEKALKKL